MHSRDHVPIGYLPDHLERDVTQLRLQAEHLKRVGSTKKMIDIDPPVGLGLPHVEVRAKKVLEEKLRREMIERDNQTLVDRIGHIMTHKSLDNSPDAYLALSKRLESNRQHAKAERTQQLARENEKARLRIQAVKSVHDRKEFLKEMAITATFVSPKRAGALMFVNKSVREAAARERALMGSRQMEKSILAATAKRETLRSSSSSLTSTGSTRPHTVASIRKFTSSTPLSPMFSPLTSTASTFDELDDEDLRDSVYAHKTTAFRPRSEELKHLVLLPDFHNHRTPFVGGDVVLAKCRCSLGDGDSRTLYPGSTLVSPTRRPTSVDTPVEPSSDEAGVETKVADDEDGIVEDATLRSEVWDISVIERGLLSSTQDDCMTCIVISGVRASDKQRHVIELDLAALKTQAHRVDGTAGMGLSRCERKRDPLDPEALLYSRLSSAVRKGYEKGQAEATKELFFLRRVVTFLLERLQLADEDATGRVQFFTFQSRK